MIRHVALFRWTEDTTPQHVASVRAGLDALPGSVPSIRAYVHGPDLCLGEGRWDYAVLADFDDPAGYAAYDEHPAHDSVRRELIVPRVRERAALQLELQAPIVR